MKSMINIRNSVIIILCITIILLGMGFMALSVQLNKKNSEVPSYKVIFTNIIKSSSVKGSNIEPTGDVKIVGDGHELDMNFELNATHDELIYIATIKNTGNIPAKIVKVMESPDYNKTGYQNAIAPVNITLSDVEGKILEPGEKLDYKITLYYNPSSNKVIKKNFNLNIGLLTESVEDKA